MLQCSPEPGALEYTTRFLEKIKDDVLKQEQASPPPSFSAIQLFGENKG